MSNVMLSIGGRSFTVACAAGEEDHVASLGRMIDAKVATMGDMTGQNESRMLLFAALLLADEIDEVKSGDSGASSGGHGIAPRLEAIAGRLENLADALEGRAGSA